MKELNDELVGEVKEFFQKYRTACSQKESYTQHNRDMKNDFITKHFEEREAEDRKQIKKEVSRYFESILMIDSGSDPVIEVKGLRRNHLDFTDIIYAELMEIFKVIVKNNEEKNELDDKIEKEIYIPMGLALGVHMDVAKGILKLWRDLELGKFPVTMAVVDGYRTIVGKLNS